MLNKSVSAVVRLFLALWLAITPTFVWAGSMTLLGVGGPAAAPTFQGPGDIVSGAIAWGSCARVYNASLAGTATSLCDLVDSAAPTVTICTLRGTTSGFVDLAGSYCTGSVTPAAKCAAATGGVCNVQKVYDQIGGSSGWLNTTASQQPVLTFSTINGLPGLTGVAASNTNMGTSTTFTQAQPVTFVAVAERTAAFTTQSSFMGYVGANNGFFSFYTSANTVALTSDGALVFTQGSVADSAFHALQGVMNSASSVIAVDGTETTGDAGTQGMSADPLRIMRHSGGSSQSGVLMEMGIWPSAFNGTQRTNMNANLHGSKGYNF